MKKIVLSILCTFLIGFISLPLVIAEEAVSIQENENVIAIESPDAGEDVTAEIQAEDADTALEDEDIEMEDENIEAGSLEKSAESLAQHAEEMAKHFQIKHKDMQEKLQKMQSHLEKMGPKLEKAMKHSLAMMEQIEMPEIPAIPAIPPIPHMPPMPHINLAHMDENFKGEIVSDKIEKTFDVKSGTLLKVDTNFSTVRIEPGTSNSQIAAAVFRKTGADTKEEAQEIMKRYEVTLEQTADAVEITVKLTNTKGEDNKGHNTMMHCDVVVTVPVKTPIELRNSFGDVGIQGIQSDIRSENKFGSTAIIKTQGTLKASSEYGQLAVQEHDGNGSVRGQFGDVFVDKLTGDLTIEVGYGKTKVSTDLKEAKIDGKFSFGEVQINLPNDYAGKVEAFASFGEIKAPDSLRREKKTFNEKVEGEIGNGQGLVQIKNSYAPVTITQGKNLFEKMAEFSKTVSEKVDKALGNDQPNVICKGVVLDAKTGQPIPNAKVGAFYMNNPPYAETTTNEDGEYSLKVWSEEHIIKASAPGYKDKTDNIDTGFLQRKKAIKINFLLESAQ